MSVILISLAGVMPCLTQAQSLTRGPYLQSGSTTSVTVKWRTSSSVVGVVKYGTVNGTLNLGSVSESSSKTDHSVTLTGLTPNTQYFYSIGHGSTVLAGGGDNFVVTAPTTAKPTRVWVVGDPGTGTTNQTNVRDAYYSFTGSTHTDLALLLGDNAYEDGTDSENQTKLFNIYQSIFQKTVFWSTIGNHDAHNDNAKSSTQTGPYFDIWTFPKAGEAGGVASGTEAYYSFDYGNIHFVCIDSYGGSSLSGTGPMANWLRSDLANNTKQWLVAFWHVPPYSRGSHYSDDSTQLTKMREIFNPILEEYGVDLVLTGHCHAYERSKFINGHYGYSSSFNSSTMVVQSGSGREDGSGAYIKANGSAAPGTVYIVTGAAGQASGSGSMDHPAHYLSLKELGSVVLDFDGNRLDAKMIGPTGAIRDYFTIIKGNDTTPPAAPTGLTATAGNAQVVLDWNDNTESDLAGYNVYRNTDGFTNPINGPLLAASNYTNTGLTNGTTYSYKVSAADYSANESNDSSQVNATPQAGNTPPTVSITAPSNGASYTAPASITITATAADSDGTVTQVDFYQGTTLLGSDTSAPYSFAWTAVAAGSYALTAKATDNNSAVTTSSTVNITVNSGGGTTTLFEDAFEPTNDFATVWSVSSSGAVYRSGSAGNSSSYGMKLKGGSGGNWAQHNQSTAGSSNIHVLFDIITVGMVSPHKVNLDWYDGSTWQNAADSTATTSWTTRDITLPAGAAGKAGFAIRFRIDDETSTNEYAHIDNIKITANSASNVPPTVSITSPSDGASYTAPASVTITAAAADSDGTVTQVDFYQGTTLLGSDTNPPYSFAWTNVAADSYALTAKATDNNSAVTTSSTVNVTVNSGSGTTTLFEDAFEPTNDFAAVWSVSSSAVYRSGSAGNSSSYGMKVKGGSSGPWAQHNQSTVGYSYIHVIYDVYGIVMTSPHKINLDWFDGSTWQTAIDSTAPSSWTTRNITLPAGAAGKSGFAIRFRMDDGTNTSEYTYVDNVRITGQ